MICQSFNCGRPATGAFCEECVTTMTVPEKVEKCPFCLGQMTYLIPACKHCGGTGVMNSQMSETLPAIPATAPTDRESVVAGCNTSLAGGAKFTTTISMKKVDSARVKDWSVIKRTYECRTDNEEN